jgi:hypothetical protein
VILGEELPVALFQLAQGIVRPDRTGWGRARAACDVAADVAIERRPQSGVQRLVEPLDDAPDPRVIGRPRPESDAQMRAQVAHVVGNQLARIVDPNLVGATAKLVPL